MIEIPTCNGALREKQQEGGFFVELVIRNASEQVFQCLLAAGLVGVEGAYGDVGEQARSGVLPCRAQQIACARRVAGDDSHDCRDAAQPRLVGRRSVGGQRESGHRQSR